MVMATRIMYLMSGILILASGLYVQMDFAERLPEALRLVAGLVGIAYFGIQLYCFLAAESRNRIAAVSMKEHRNFGLDFMKK